MNLTILSRKDFPWLREVHGIPTKGTVVAVLYGNEDSPDKVLLYSRNHIDCLPTVWERRSDRMVKTQIGD